MFVAHEPGRSKGAIRIFIERMFKEHARDQQHLCAEAVEVVGLAAHDAHESIRAAAMNTPAPGEKQ